MCTRCARASAYATPWRRRTRNLQPEPVERRANSAHQRWKAAAQFERKMTGKAATGQGEGATTQGRREENVLLRRPHYIDVYLHASQRSSGRTSKADTGAAPSKRLLHIAAPHNLTEGGADRHESRRGPLRVSSWARPGRSHTLERTAPVSVPERPILPPADARASSLLTQHLLRCSGRPPVSSSSDLPHQASRRAA
jgi:hypothetical protein